MEQENYELALRAMADSHNFTEQEKEDFVKKNIDYVLLRSYGEWSEKDALERYEFLQSEKDLTS